MSYYCPICGDELKEITHYCPHCGEDLSEYLGEIALYSSTKKERGISLRKWCLEKAIEIAKISQGKYDSGGILVVAKDIEEFLLRKEE